MKRICMKCGLEKDLSEFYLLPHGKYGHQARCKKCQIADQVKRQRQARLERGLKRRRYVQLEIARKRIDDPEPDPSGIAPIPASPTIWELEGEFYAKYTIREKGLQPAGDCAGDGAGDAGGIAIAMPDAVIPTATVGAG